MGPQYLLRRCTGWPLIERAWIERAHWSRSRRPTRPRSWSNWAERTLNKEMKDFLRERTVMFRTPGINPRGSLPHPRGLATYLDLLLNELFGMINLLR